MIARHAKLELMVARHYNPHHPTNVHLHIHIYTCWRWRQSESGRSSIKVPCVYIYILNVRFRSYGLHGTRIAVDQHSKCDMLMSFKYIFLSVTTRRLRSRPSGPYARLQSTFMMHMTTRHLNDYCICSSPSWRCRLAGDDGPGVYGRQRVVKSMYIGCLRS
jgi:hypothetical protein